MVICSSNTETKSEFVFLKNQLNLTKHIFLSQTHDGLHRGLFNLYVNEKKSIFSSLIDAN